MNLAMDEKDPYSILDNIIRLPNDILVDTIRAEGFPSGGVEPFKEVIINDFVGDVMRVIVSDYKVETNREDMFLTREKEIVSIDEETGGNIEFILIDTVSVSKDIYLIVVESKRDSLGKGIIQCLLSLKDMYDVNNDNKSVYGFVTTGIDWKLIKYDGLFTISDKMTLLFSRMSDRKEEWLQRCSQVVDVIYRTVVDNNV
jgi:hypothetical protein